MRNDMRFAHAAARVGILETRLLDRGRIERLLETSGVDEVLRLLAETEYGPAVAALKGGDDYEAALSAELERAYALVGSFAPEPRLLEAWAARNAFHNLKALLKASLRGEPVEPAALAPASPVARDVLESAVGAALARGGPGGGGSTGPAALLPVVPAIPPRVRIGGSVGERISGPELGGFLARAAGAAVLAFRARGGPEDVDQAVDLVYQEYLLACAAVPGAEFLRGWVERWTDLTNLRTFLRFALGRRGAETLARALLPGGSLPAGQLAGAYAGTEEEGARLAALEALVGGTPYAGVVAEGLRRFEAEGLLSGFERAADLFLLQYLRGARRLAFGMAPVWAYLMTKEQEVRVLRLILVGKTAGLTREKLRERLSDVYA